MTENPYELPTHAAQTGVVPQKVVQHRPSWQFSLRGLMWLVLASSILFAVSRHFGFVGVVWFALALAVVLVVVGIVRRKFHFAICGCLILTLLFAPATVAIAIVGCILYFLAGGVILITERLVKLRSSNRGGD